MGNNLSRLLCINEVRTWAWGHCLKSNSESADAYHMLSGCSPESKECMQNLQVVTVPVLAWKHLGTISTRVKVWITY